MEDEHAEPTTTYLVEHYWPGVTKSAFAEAAESVRVAAEAMAAEGAPVRYRHSTLVPDDEVALCVFAADSQSLVEEAYSRAGVRYERIVEAVESVAGSPRIEARRA